MTAAAGAHLSLVCFPHAGGSAIRFFPWRQELAGCADVVPVELPGRTTRRAEPLRHSVPELVESVLPAVRSRAAAGDPVALYGHSLGALLAFELAHRLTADGTPPALLVVSGRNGPSRQAEIPPVHRLPDDEFLTALEGTFGGTPPEVLADPDLLALFLPQIRADLEAAETYAYREREPLGCPLVVLQGKADPMVSPDGVATWREETTADCDIVWYAGDHFFHQHKGFAAAALRPRLAALASRYRASTPSGS